MWANEIMAPFTCRLKSARPVALVDSDPGAFPYAREATGLPEECCYLDLETAFAQHEADFAIVSSPTQFHEEAVDTALKYDMDILCEKPIAHTMEACCRTYRKVKQAGKKMAVIMSHRFDQDKQTLQRRIRSGDYGRLDYLVGRNTWACRKVGSWGPGHRYRKPDPLLTEGTVHHFDIIRSLTGSDARTVHAVTWNPEWSEFSGDAQALVLLEMVNGVKAVYEGAMTNATFLNNWCDEYFRAECEGGTLVLDHRKLLSMSDLEGERKEVELPLDEQEFWLDRWIVQMFLDWLDGGEPPPCSLEDNIQCATCYSTRPSSRPTRDRSWTCRSFWSQT
jgi:predicted dehydrogenase